jgi:benzodiazapine receptor
MENIPTKFTFWHALGIYVLANGVSALAAGFLGDFEFYNSFVQPKIAPPDWLFAPMWFFLNVTSLWAFYRVANSEDKNDKKIFLRLEIIFWVIYATFTLFYFGLQSPILGAINTVTGLLITIASFVYALRLDKLSAYLIALRLLWVLLASYVSVYMALFNNDFLFSH